MNDFIPPARDLPRKRRYDPATVAPPQPKGIYWPLLLLALALAAALAMFWGSGFYAQYRLQQAMQAADSYALAQRIPDALLQHLFPDIQPQNKWQGPGHDYLAAVWPQVYAHTNRHDLLQLQYQQNTADSRTYWKDWQHLRWEWGTADQAMRLTLTRQGLWRYAVTDLCYQQPAQSTAKRCPSDSR